MHDELNTHPNSTDPAVSDPSALDAARRHIDEIDLQIQSLINERARYAQKVGHAKGRFIDPTAYYRPEREAQILRQAVARNTGPLPNETVVEIFRQIMSACLAQQGPLQISYLGPEGTFCQQAMHKQFGFSVHGVSCPSIESVFESVESEQTHMGVVPVENSSQGYVHTTLDAFLNTSVQIIGETELPVHQFLLSTASDCKNIMRIYAHSQSLAQTAGWLRTHLPEAEKIAVSSNADAAQRAKNDPQAAAIAGEWVASLYGLQKVIKDAIEDKKNNTTRFLVLGRRPCPPSGLDRTSLLVMTQNRAGALRALLAPFAEYHVNITRIHSRPSHQGKWTYAFFIDVDGHIQDPNMVKVMDALQAETLWVKLLGAYPVVIT